ncbi:MAG: AAA family ATPase [Erysipelotrichia bacterium]|nr:AAA family ATPase [Erysipelotrichia bacterium]
MKTIKRIVFTGGPCSGKTTFMSRAEEIFAERGYRVIVDHESATDLISGGISPATMGMVQFQKYCIALQLKKEELCYQAAQEIEGEKVLIFIDRGIHDDKGYVSEEDFKNILEQFSMKEEDINKRYDLVMHMVTSAKGQEEAYTLSNNAARYESIEDAQKVDDMILDSWKDHPNRVIVNNDVDFEKKLRRAIQAVFAYLGDEKPIEVFKKYLVELNDEVLEKVKGEKNISCVHILQHYLKSTPPMEKRIRRREKDGNTLYYYSEATMLTANKRIKRDRIISERQYIDYSLEIDPQLKMIDKERYGFIYNNHFFKLDVFSFDKSKALLSVQVPTENEKIIVPDYFRIIKDVTDNPDYKNYYLAKSQKF